MSKYSKDEIAGHYNDFDELYENWSGGMQGGYHYGFAKKISDVFYNDRMISNLSDLIAESLNIKKNGENQRIFDAGCGVGDVSAIVAKYYSEAKIHGVTISARQCAIAQEKHPPTDKLCILKGDFEVIKFEDNFFDAVFFVDSICHGTGDDKKSAIAEAYRVLRPGGRLVVCDVFLQKQRSQWSRWFNFINKQMLDRWRVNEWIIEKQFKKSVEKMGFIDYKSNNLKWKIVPSVLHMIFTKVPQAAWKSLQNKAHLKDLRSFVHMSIFAPLLGMHPNFRYQLVTLQKPLKK